MAKQIDKPHGIPRNNPEKGKPGANSMPKYQGPPPPPPKPKKKD